MWKFSEVFASVRIYSDAFRHIRTCSAYRKTQDQKLKIAESFLDALNQVVDDKSDLKTLTDYFEGQVLPRFQKGGGVEITPLPRANFGNGGAAGADDNFLTLIAFDRY